jgi:hypothetical protein
MGTGGPFPAVKGGRTVTLTTHPVYFRGQECVGAILSLPLGACMVVAGQLYLLV